MYNAVKAWQYCCGVEEASV